MRLHSRFAAFAMVLTILAAAFALSASPGKADSQSVEHAKAVGTGLSHTFTSAAAHVNTTNHTRYETWVDISWAYAVGGWHIEKAFCLVPGASSPYTVHFQHANLGPQVRVRAEIKLAGCAKGTHTVVSGEGKLGKLSENFMAEITENPAAHFRMSFAGQP